MHADASLLTRIDREVNASIRFESNIRWHTVNGAGSCTTFAMEKWHRLLALGVDPRDMHIILVTLPNGTSHALLNVRDDHGRVWLLDSRTPDLELARDTLNGGYRLTQVLWGTAHDLDD